MRTSTSPSASANVYLRLHWHQRSPGIPDWEGEVEYWILGNQFHLRDGNGRYLYEILEEHGPGRGLGYQAKTLEEMMDIRSRIGASDPVESTDIYYDGDAQTAFVKEGLSDLRAVDAASVSHLCDGLFAGGEEAKLTKISSGKQAGLPYVAYQGITEGTWQGQSYRNQCTLRVAGNYVLLRKHAAEGSPDWFLEQKVVEIGEGGVVAADVRAGG